MLHQPVSEMLANPFFWCQRYKASAQEVENFRLLARTSYVEVKRRQIQFIHFAYKIRKKMKDDKEKQKKVCFITCQLSIISYLCRRIWLNLQ